jgi:uncharacterized membrane protein
MKATYSALKKRAKDRLNANFGDGFLIILVPWLIVLIANSIVGRIFPTDPEELFTTNYIINQLVSYALSIYSGYIIIRMILPYARGKNGITFKGFFEFDHKFLQYAMYQIIIVVIQFFITLPPLRKTPELLDTLQSNMDNPDFLIDFIQSQLFMDWINAWILSFALSIVFWIILVKLRMVPYIIIDKAKTFTEAISLSWSMTNGNFFRILFFPFAFILWFLLVLITCGLGIVYVMPLLTVAQAYLYLAICKENGLEDDVIDDFVVEEQVDPLDNFYE